MNMIDGLRVLRRLRRAPRYCLAVVLSAACSVGPAVVALAMFSAVFVRQPAVKAPGELFAVHTARMIRGEETAQLGGMSYPDYEDLRATLPRESWRYAAAWKVREFSRTSGPVETSVRVAAYAGDYFQIANAQVVRGAFPGPDDRQGVVVTQRLARELAAAGGTDQLILLGQPFRVVAVVEDGFRGIDPRDGVEAWIQMTALPAVEASSDLLTFRELEDLSMLVQTSPAGSKANLRAYVAFASARLAVGHEANRQGWRLWIGPLRPSFASIARTRAGQAAVAPLIIVLCVLLIAATNIANLAAVRAAGRQREAQLWLAMGMPKARLMVLECAEPAVLSVLGGLVGGTAGAVMLRYIASLPIVETFGLRLDTLAVVGAGLATILFGALCTLLPALRLVRLRERDIVHQGHGITARGVSALQRVYLVLQFTLALAFTCVALQIAQAVRQQGAVNVGFDTQKVLVVTGVAGAPGRTPADWARDYDRVAAAVGAVRGVQSVAGSVAEFFGGYQMSKRTLSSAPSSSAGSDGLVAAMDVVSPGYFASLGLRVQAGREFTPQDGSGPLARIVVNESMAHRIAGGDSAVGRTVYELGQYPLEIIGIVPDIRATASEVSQPVYYRSLAQSPLPAFVLYARVTAPTQPTMGAVTTAVSRAMPESAGRLKIQTAEAQRQTRDAPARLLFGLSVALAGIALLITALGLYGVASYVTLARSQEYGIRAALGASPRALALSVFRDGLGWTGLAAMLSLPTIWVGTKVSRALVLGVDVFPLVTAVILILIYTAAVFLALLGPAHRAASESPADALRAQ